MRGIALRAGARRDYWRRISLRRIASSLWQNNASMARNRRRIIGRALSTQGHGDASMPRHSLIIKLAGNGRDDIMQYISAAWRFLNVNLFVAVARPMTVFQNNMPDIEPRIIATF